MTENELSWMQICNYRQLQVRAVVAGWLQMGHLSKEFLKLLSEIGCIHDGETSAAPGALHRHLAG